jgi:hypothetical protein
MASTALDLPIDIQWRRLATSPDMMDRTFGDRRFPHRHSSSIALFYYEPTVEDEDASETKITYLKMVCTVTGLNLSNALWSESLFLNLVEGEQRLPPGRSISSRRISGMSSPFTAMYCLCSICLSRIACLAYAADLSQRQSLLPGSCGGTVAVYSMFPGGQSPCSRLEAIP